MDPCVHCCYILVDRPVMYNKVWSVSGYAMFRTSKLFDGAEEGKETQHGNYYVIGEICIYNV